MRPEQTRALIATLGTLLRLKSIYQRSAIFRPASESHGWHAHVLPADPSLVLRGLAQCGTPQTAYLLRSNVLKLAV